MVERLICNEDVAGSTPVSGSNLPLKMPHPASSAGKDANARPVVGPLKCNQPFRMLPLSNPCFPTAQLSAMACCSLRGEWAIVAWSEKQKTAVNEKGLSSGSLSSFPAARSSIQCCCSGAGQRLVLFSCFSGLGRHRPPAKHAPYRNGRCWPPGSGPCSRLDCAR